MFWSLLLQILKHFIIILKLFKTYIPRCLTGKTGMQWVFIKTKEKEQMNPSDKNLRWIFDNCYFYKTVQRNF